MRRVRLVVVFVGATADARGQHTVSLFLVKPILLDLFLDLVEHLLQLSLLPLEKQDLLDQEAAVLLLARKLDL